jgi:protein-disulfide isomerase
LWASHSRVRVLPRASFAKDGFPKIKTNYIDTGKVRFIFREFPLDQIAVAASAAARCIAQGDSAKYFELVDSLFRRQDELKKDPLDTINGIGKPAGFSEARIKACVDDDPACVSPPIADETVFTVPRNRAETHPWFD